MKRSSPCLAVLCWLGISSAYAGTVLTPTWDGIYEWRGTIPRVPTIADNFNLTSYHLPIYKNFIPAHLHFPDRYAEDVSMIAFDLRSLRQTTAVQADLIVVREDGDLVNSLFVDLFLLEDDAIATPNDFYRVGIYVGQIEIMPRPNGGTLEEQAVDVTAAIRLAVELGMDFAGLRLEPTGPWRTDGVANYIHSTEYNIFPSPRLEVHVPATVLGFYPPIEPPSVATNSAKAGRTIPLKFFVESAGTAITNLSTATLTVTSVSCLSVPMGQDVVEEYSAPKSAPLENLGGGYYQYNWSTSKDFAGLCKSVSLALPDLYDGYEHPFATFDFSRK